MWRSESFEFDWDVTDLDSFYNGTKPAFPANEFRLGDNFTTYRDMAAQRALARLTSNPQLRNPEVSPASGARRRNQSWYIPNTPEPPRWDRHEEPFAPVTRKASVLPPIKPTQNHIVNQNQKANRPLNKVSQVAEALNLLEEQDWEKKIRGIDTIISLLSSNSEAASQKIKDLRTAVIGEVTNLRSAVSLAAIKCLDVMFSTLRTRMDYDLHQSVKVLLHKAGEANTFIREAVDSALSSMVDHVSPGRALTALIEAGLCHKNSTVRSTTVKHLTGLVDKMGPEFILSGKKGITDRAIPAVAQAVQDSCPQARMYGRNILSILAPHPSLGTLLKKYVPPKDLPAIKLLLKKCPI